jgi:hypothetical protein
MDSSELEPVDEKRMHERSDCKGLIKWSYFNNSNYFGGELFNPQISQIAQITLNAECRLRNLPGLIPRSLLR